MKRVASILLVFLFALTLNAQTVVESFKSRKMNSVRSLKIQLPENYDPDSDVQYPLVVVFDAEYLFEPIAGQIKFQKYFDEMPPVIIVGIVQGNERFYDSYFDEVSGLPFESGSRFYEFIGQELLPYLGEKYSIGPFKMAVGHNIMGNFINSFILKDDPIFSAYVNLSPDLNGAMGRNVAERLSYIKKDIFYYMATSDKDIPAIRKTILETNDELVAIDNDNFNYYFDDFKNESHYTLVTGAISRAFDQIFDLYKPISEKELVDKVKPYKGTLDQYLVGRYQKIKNLFGVVKEISEDEFQKMVSAAEDRNDLESLEQLGKLARKEFPDSMLGTYYLAQYYEKSGKPKKARKLYESALELESTPLINKEYIMSLVEKMEVVGQDDEIDEIDDENDN